MKACFLRAYYKAKSFKRLTICTRLSHQVKSFRLMLKLRWTDAQLWALARSFTRLLNRNHSTAASSAAGRCDRHLCWQRWQKINNDSQGSTSAFHLWTMIKAHAFHFISWRGILWDLYFKAVRRQQIKTKASVSQVKRETVVDVALNI